MAKLSRLRQRYPTQQEWEKRKDELKKAFIKFPFLPYHIQRLEEKADAANKSPWWKKKELIEEIRQDAENIQKPLSAIGVKIKILDEKGEEWPENRVEVTDVARKLATLDFANFIDKRANQLKKIITYGKPLSVLDKLASDLKKMIEEALKPVQGKLFG
ncbi:MAG: hypothetical protein QXH27_04650 [Candidatus Micrarchaeia archaeon]